MSARILVIDDDLRTHELVDFHLKGVVEHVSCASNGTMGCAMARNDQPDLILLDIDMPGQDGFAVCRALKEDESTRAIPIVFLTAERAPNQVARGLDLGGVDYIQKPFEVVELQARVRAALRTRRMMLMLEELARVDELTGLPNRAAMESSLDDETAVHERSGKRCSVALLDIDFFKKINDEYGHGVGDEVLRRIGTLLAGSTRAQDFTARYGGEEFLVLLRETSEFEAHEIMARLREAFRELSVPVEGGFIEVRFSAGLASHEVDGDELSPRELLRLADDRLNKAKKCGRDRVVSAGDVEEIPQA